MFEVHQVQQKQPSQVNSNSNKRSPPQIMIKNTVSPSVSPSFEKRNEHESSTPEENKSFQDKLKQFNQPASGTSASSQSRFGPSSSKLNIRPNQTNTKSGDQK